MAVLAVHVAKCDGCHGMLSRTKGDETVTQDLTEAAVFRTPPQAATAANTRGWRVWIGWRESGEEYVTRLECPQDRT